MFNVWGRIIFHKRVYTQSLLSFIPFLYGYQSALFYFFSSTLSSSKTHPFDAFLPICTNKTLTPQKPPTRTGKSKHRRARLRTDETDFMRENWFVLRAVRALNSFTVPHRERARSAGSSMLLDLRLAAARMSATLESSVVDCGSFSAVRIADGKIYSRLELYRTMEREKCWL